MAARRITAALCLPAFLAVGVGLPVPGFQPGSAEQFPCVHHHCGCRTAAICRTHCCCFKPVTPRCCATRDTADREDPAARSGDRRSIDIVMNALDCQGVSAMQMVLTPMFPPPDVSDALRSHAPGRRVVVAPSDPLPMSALSPPTPPPRV